MSPKRNRLELLLKLYLVVVTVCFLAVALAGQKWLQTIGGFLVLILLGTAILYLIQSYDSKHRQSPPNRSI